MKNETAAIKKENANIKNLCKKIAEVKNEISDLKRFPKVQIKISFNNLKLEHKKNHFK